MNRQYRQQIAPVVQQIIKKLRPGKIFCYAIINHAQVCWGTVMPNEIGYEHLHFHLLVISHLPGQREIQRLVNKVQKHEVQGIAVTVVAQPIKLIQRHVRAGDSFLNTVLTHGHLLYNDHKLALPACVAPLPVQTKKSTALSKIHLTMAGRFYHTAVNAIIEDDHPMAMYLLHQAVKEASMAIIQLRLSVTMKYAPLQIQWGTILVAMPSLSKIFPRNTEEEDELFLDLCAAPQLLRQPNYYIAPHKVHVLSPRVNNLLEEIDIV